MYPNAIRSVVPLTTINDMAFSKCKEDQNCVHPFEETIIGVSIAITHKIVSIGKNPLEFVIIYGCK